jgi:hypothetical protein
MSDQDRFPEGWDYAWIAQDCLGRVAVLTNAGVGPLPLKLLACRELGDRAEVMVRALPVRGEHTLLVSLPRPDDFIACAKRGLYVYDWQDVHRRDGKTHRYELLAIPHAPLSVSELPDSLNELAALARFASLNFADSPLIALPGHIPCYPNS